VEVNWTVSVAWAPFTIN